MVELIVGPSVRPSCGVGGGSSSLGGNGERERGELEMGTACKLHVPRPTSVLLTDGPTDRPADLAAFPTLLLLLLMKRKTQEVGKSDGRTVDDGVKDGRNGGKGREREGRRNE